MHEEDLWRCCFCGDVLSRKFNPKDHEDLCVQNPMRGNNWKAIREEIRTLVEELGISRSVYSRLSKDISDKGLRTPEDERAMLYCLRNKKTYRDYKAKTARLMAGGKAIKPPSSRFPEIVLHVEDATGKRPFDKKEADPFASEEGEQTEQTIEVKLRLRIQIAVGEIQVLKVE